MENIRHIFSTRKRSVGVIIVLLLVIGITGWNVFLRGKGNQPQYQTATVARGTIINSVSASGKVLTSRLVPIATSATGVVKKVWVKDGDRVNADDTIAEISLDQLGAQKHASALSSYLSSKTTLESAKATAYTLQSDMLTKWKTYKEIAESSTYQNADGSPKTESRTLVQFYTPYDDWLAAEAKYKNQQAVIEQAAASVQNSWLSYQLTAPTISAPIAGIVSNITLVEGIVLSSQSTTDQTSASTQRVAVLQHEGNPLVSINLSETDVPKVILGQKATVKLDSIADKTFTGVVATVDRIGTTSNGVTSYPATIKLDTAPASLLPNMAANITIIIEMKSDVLTVPQTAVQTQDGQLIARVLREGKELQIPVETGIDSDTQTEILSGLSEGDVLITGTSDTSDNQQTGRSVFGGGFGGGAFRPGGFGGGTMRR